MGNGNIWLDGPFLLPAWCPCRRRPLPACVTCGLLPRVLQRTCPWVQSQAMALFWWRGPVLSLHPLVLFLGAVARKLAPISLLLPLQAGAQVRRHLEMGVRGVCGARLGQHTELGVVPQLPGPAWSAIGCCELLQLCSTCAHGTGTGLAAKASFQMNCGLTLGALQPTLPEPQQHRCHTVATKR